MEERVLQRFVCRARDRRIRPADFLDQLGIVGDDEKLTTSGERCVDRCLNVGRGSRDSREACAGVLPAAPLSEPRAELLRDVVNEIPRLTFRHVVAWKVLRHSIEGVRKKDRCCHLVRVGRVDAVVVERAVTPLVVHNGSLVADSATLTKELLVPRQLVLVVLLVAGALRR
jgi:hypothetical protein